MRCIYCLEESSSTKGVAHVVPEGVVQNSMVLPKGTVCDSCNNYLGHELDSVLVAHPMLSVAIQALHLRGKGGRQRDKVGNVDRTVAPGWITIPTEKPIERHTPDGRTFTARPLIDASFDFGRFRRSLHHVGLNLLAFSRSPDSALTSQFDAVRRYVRNPRKGEAWPFAQKLFTHFDTELKFGINEIEGRAIAAMTLLSGAFFVALVAPHDVEHFSQASPELDYLSADYLPPRPPKQGATRYRLRIQMD